ncbi:cysteine--tRNA ligase [Candidatus Saccharibacteria bacterium RIFCSPHIGHO2_12_FULL_47_16b]|nr:MAG: cysteine--tRNA ligase [Candidatus Saccharibacteria bacterium RIFCSPHIGHO2_12_FULL_47_16b]
MKLFNSLTQKIEEFSPIKKGQVLLYTCGPTVYDHVHIGNLRTYVFEDTLRRALKATGYGVKHVMNITDIEDKIFARANQTNQDFKILTAKYEKIFLKDISKIRIDLHESKLIRASQAITEMQELIRQIPNRYIEDDGVYFDIGNYKDYGRFVTLDRSHQHHRINNDEYDKEHVADFALWKAKKPDEPSWDFKIDGKNIEGRPGWHIECSAMSVKYLGQPFDIHTGGVDLKFPHHENEIAQSRAATGKELASFFVHAEHLLVDGRKMSKSLNNFLTLEDVIAKGFDPIALRLLFLQAHYRSQLNFTWDSIGAAQTNLKSLQAFADLRFQTQPGATSTPDDYFTEQQESILADLSNDLATPTALAKLDKIIDLVGSSGVDPTRTLNQLNQFLEFLDLVFGLELLKSNDITPEQKQLITKREEARVSKNWAKADELRQQLKSQKIELNDTELGPIWYRA